MKRIIAVGLVASLIPLFGAKKAQAIPQANGSANVVIGQASMTGANGNQGSSTDANTINDPWDVFYDGTRLFVADGSNHRVLIYNSLPTSSNASADVVVGQPNMSSNSANQGGGATPNSRTLNYPSGVYSDGTKLFIADHSNHRVLIYNTIPTTNNAAANVVIGQADMDHGSMNAGGGGTASAKSFNYPNGVFVAGGKLFIADQNNSRVMIFNSVPTSDYQSANVAVGQSNLTNNSANQGAGAGANTLNAPSGVYSDGTKLLIADYNNKRVLVFNSIPTSSNVSANVVIGQANMSSVTANQGGSVGANTMNSPWGLTTLNGHLLIGDTGNSRVLVYDSIPTSSNASATAVLGQASLAVGGTTSAQANTLSGPQGISVAGRALAVADRNYNRVMLYKLEPTLAEVSAPSTNSFTPSYTFSSDEAGTIGYGGSCASTATAAVAGDNTITFNTLSAGTYSDCTVIVTNGAGFASATLAVSSFTLSPYASSNLTLAPSNVAYAKKKSKNRRATLTVSQFNLSRKAKKSWATIRVNNKKMKVTGVKNSGANLRVTFKLVYGKWAIGSYNLSFSYRNKVGNSWENGTFSGDNILTVY